MHLLAAQPGVISDGSEAVDLGQSSGDIVVLSAADTELACLAAARAGFDDEFPSLRLANLLQLSHNLSVDVYVEAVISGTRLVVVRLLGGVGYWPYGVERIAETCRTAGIALAMLPGDDQPDAELARLSTLPPEVCHRLWQFTVHGGNANAFNFLAYAATLIGRVAEWREPAPILRAGLYWPGLTEPNLDELRARWRADAPIASLVFYRALVQAGDLAPIEAMIQSFQKYNLNPLPIYLHSLK